MSGPDSPTDERRDIASAGARGWERKADVLRDHRGMAIPLETRAFFCEPPPEIGHVISAWSTLPHGKKPMDLGTRMGIILIAVLAGFGIGVAIDVVASPKDAWMIVWPVLWMLLGFTAGFGHTDGFYTVRCTYVGSEGFAHFLWSGRNKPTCGALVRFANVAAIDFRLVVRRTNDSYDATDWTFVCTFGSKRDPIHVTGTYHSESDQPGRDDEYWFYRKAYEVWAAGAIPQLLSMLAAGETIDFRYDDDSFALAVTSKGFVFPRGRERAELPFSELAKYTTQQRPSGGIFLTLSARNASSGLWRVFSSTGHFEIELTRLRNRVGFLALLDAVFDALRSAAAEGNGFDWTPPTKPLEKPGGFDWGSLER